MTKLHATVIDQGPLTNKEAQILRYLCEGYTRPEIAITKVFRTVSTVNKHVEQLANKLDAGCTAEIVATAVAINMVKVEIKHHHSLITRCLMVMLMFNVTASHVDLRRGPSSPKPIRTVRVASRAVRNQKQFS